MPELDPIGRVADTSTLELEPITVPVVGYTEAAKEVVTKIRFKARPAPGVAFDMLAAIDSKGKILNSAVLKFLDGCVLSDDRDKWHELLYGDRVMVEQETVTGVYQAVAEYYEGTNRPSRQRPGSPSGRSRTAPTSRAAASGRESAGKRSA